ncbi:bursicon isoform X1 [Palaemon carinicauda]|uniref:bursicon isoform X1 n=2 Tax=Palaemon carinicauda TaxID=392227 RepID=UPI0035B68091
MGARYKKKLTKIQSRPTFEAINRRHLTSVRKMSATMTSPVSLFFFFTWTLMSGITSADECSLTPVIHILSYPGCNSKPIPSFACQGRCTSYVQVSGSKIWQTERSCMCCQESGEREATVTLNCPKARVGDPKRRKVLTRAPVDCMCRPCTDVEEGTVLAQEIANFIADDPMAHVPFLK